MKNIVAVMLLASSLALSGCGANSHGMGNINGTWNATMSDSGVETLGFVTNLTVNGDGTLGTSSLNITVNTTTCAFPAVTETGTFTLSGNFNGQVTGAFHYVVTSTGTLVNTLTLDGTVKSGKIAGNWAVTGSSGGCHGQGTFTMIPMLGA
jgi:hypothetical protein